MATTSKKRSRKVSRTKKICVGCNFICDVDPLTAYQARGTGSFTDNDLIKWHNIPEYLNRKQFLRYYRIRQRKLEKYNTCQDYRTDINGK